MLATARSNLVTVVATGKALDLQAPLKHGTLEKMISIAILAQTVDPVEKTLEIVDVS